MKSLAEFFTEHNARRWRGPDLASQQGKPTPALHPDVCATANRGLKVFPVPDFARFSGYPEQLIAEATCDVARLEELAEEHWTISWRVAIGPSGLCALQTDGPVGRSSLAVLTEDQTDCSTLCARRAETTWANFRWPSGMVLRANARRLAPGSPSSAMVKAIPSRHRKAALGQIRGLRSKQFLSGCWNWRSNLQVHPRGKHCKCRRLLLAQVVVDFSNSQLSLLIARGRGTRTAIREGFTGAIVSAAAASCAETSRIKETGSASRCLALALHHVPVSPKKGNLN